MLLSKQGCIIGTDDVRHKIASCVEDCAGTYEGSLTVEQDGTKLVLLLDSGSVAELDREAAAELAFYAGEYARTGRLPSHPYLGKESGEDARPTRAMANGRRPTATAQAGAGAGPS